MPTKCRINKLGESQPVKETSLYFLLFLPWVIVCTGTFFQLHHNIQQEGAFLLLHIHCFFISSSSIVWKDRKVSRVRKFVRACVNVACMLESVPRCLCPMQLATQNILLLFSLLLLILLQYILLHLPNRREKENEQEIVMDNELKRGETGERPS